MNELTEEKRYKLKIAIILFVTAFIVLYGISMFIKYTQSSHETQQTKVTGQVVFRQPTLHFFQYKIQLNAYPDRITIHYPYLLVVRPDQFRSEIYNMETKRKEKEVNEVLLDYVNGDSVYNKQGYQTFFNSKDLGLLCDRAFIKNKTAILCITRIDQNTQENKLIAINPQTLEQKDVYKSQNVLTAIYFEKNILYIGEYDTNANKAFITVNGKSTSIKDLVTLFYPMNNYVYAASFKSKRNNMTESYTEIVQKDATVTTNLKGEGTIVFYKQQ